MARARLLKPGFFSNEDLLELPFETRLLFAGLWTIADREGRLEDRPKRIKLALFPGDNIDVDEHLTLLAKALFIERYEVMGEKYILVRNFVKHQQPHYMEPMSVLPGPDGDIGSSTTSAAPVYREQRRRIFERDGFVCVACGSDKQLSIDHIRPRSLGGDSSDSNLQTLCRSCNTSKRNRTQAEFLSSRGASPIEFNKRSMRLQPVIDTSSIRASATEAVTVTVTETEAKAESVAESVPRAAGDAEPPEPALDLTLPNPWNEVRQDFEGTLGLCGGAIVEDGKKYARLVPALWFHQALEETRTKAERPSWKYCKAILDRAIAEQQPPVREKKVRAAAGSARAQLLERYKTAGGQI